MSSARSSSPPDLMALLCLMGGAVRGAGELQVLMQLITIAALVPSFGLVLEAWISAEERAGLCADATFDDDLADGDEDEIGFVMTRQKGRMLLWQHVTRFGTVMQVLMDCSWLRRAEPLAPARAAWSVVWLLSPAVFQEFFGGGLGVAPTHALLVTIT